MIYVLFKITHLTTGRFVFLESATGCWYRIDDESFERVYSDPVWCGTCRRFRNGERLESVEEVEKKLAERRDPLWRPPFEKAFPETKSEVREELVRNCEQRLEWRRRRVAPAKCLKCGSSEIIRLPLDEAVPHPGGKGRILVHIESAGGISPRGQTLYTPEGDLIGWEDDL